MNEKGTEKKSVFRNMRKALSVLSELINLLADTKRDQEQSELLKK